MRECPQDDEADKKRHQKYKREFQCLRDPECKPRGDKIVPVLRVEVADEIGDRKEKTECRRDVSSDVFAVREQGRGKSKQCECKQGDACAEPFSSEPEQQKAKKYG